MAVKSKKTKKKEDTHKEFDYVSEVEGSINTICIDFNSIFNKSTNEQFNFFNLSKKRTYCNVRAQIVESLNKVFDYDSIYNEGKYLVKYFRLKAFLDHEKSEERVITLDDFKSYLKNTLMGEDYKMLVNKYIDDVCVLTMSKTSDDNEDGEPKNQDLIKKALQFTDDHAKMLFKIVTGMRVVIPLAMQYIYYYADEYPDEGTDSLILTFIEETMEIFSDDNVDMIQKVYKLIESRILATRYSDKKIWYYYQNLGIDHIIANDTLYKKSIVDLLPKLEINKSPVSFMHVFIKKQIEFLFRYNFTITYKAIDTTRNTADENNSEFDKIEIDSAKINESKSILTKIAIDDIISKISKKFNLNIGKDELDFYMEHVEKNKLQQSLVFNFFAKYFNSYDDLYNCNLTQYKNLVLMTKKIFQQSGLGILAEYVTADISNYQERKQLDKKTIEKVTKCSTYDYIVNYKYNNVSMNLLDSNTMIKMIATLTINRFTYVDFDNPKNLGKEIELDLDNVIIQYLNFIKLI